MTRDPTQRLCLISRAVADGQPVAAVVFHGGNVEEPLDSGFVLLAPDDSFDPDDHDAETGWAVVCLGCLIDDHPEAGRGIDLAREHGAAVVRAGEWEPE